MGTPLIGTRRLILRPWSERDIGALHQLWTEPAVKCSLWGGEAIPIERATETVRGAILAADSDGVGSWTVAMASAPASVFGFCGMRFFESPLRPELLIALVPEYWGQGYGTEACSALLAHAFRQGFDCMYARAAADNHRSIRMLDRLGMRLDARTWIEDTPDFYFSITREEFRRLHSQPEDAVGCGAARPGRPPAGLSSG